MTKAKIPNFLVVALDERTVTFLKVTLSLTLTPNPNHNPNPKPNPNPNPNPTPNLPTGEEDAALPAEATLGLRLDGQPRHVRPQVPDPSRAALREQQVASRK